MTLQLIAVFANHSVRTISNNVDTSVFVPITRLLHDQYSLPLDAKIVLIGSLKLTDFYKGLDLCIEALRLLTS